MKAKRQEPEMGAVPGNLSGGGKRLREDSTTPPRDNPGDDPGVVVSFIVTPADAATLEAIGGPEVLAGILTEATERDGLRAILAALRHHPEDSQEARQA